MEGNRFDVSGRVVIITGAGQGIGRDYALAFAEAGQSQSWRKSTARTSTT